MNLTIIYSLNRTIHSMRFAVLKVFELKRAQQIISIKLLSFTVLSYI